ncbi:MAG: hypothetical protein AAF596_03365 [Planctomycetota bacterium]
MADDDENQYDGNRYEDNDDVEPEDPDFDDREERFFYTEGEDGKRQDAEIQEPFLAASEASSFFALEVIREHVEEGATIEEALDLFGTDELRAAHAAGTLDITAADPAEGDS